MGKVTIISGPPFSGKTAHIISEISKLNPFDYTFIGSQGESVKSIASYAAQKIGSINRSAFKTIDQFAVSLVRSQTNLVFADRSLKIVILSSVIEDMATRNLNMPEELKMEAGMISRKSTVEKLLSLIDDIKTYMKEGEFSNPENFRDAFIEGVMTRFKEKMDSMKLFDTYDAYRLVAEGKVKASGKNLFIDGFYDFTPVVGKFFKAIVSSFESTYITVTTGEIFEFGSATIMDAVKDLNPIVIKKEFSGNGVAKGLFGRNGDGVKVHRFGKPSEEIEWVCKKAKALLLEGYDPQDFEIVVKSENSNYIKAIENKLAEYSIGLSYLGKKKLSQNTAVQKVMLPLRVASGGYPQDLLMSMIIAGFGGETAEFPLIYSKAHLERGPMKLSYSSRLEDWERRLDNFGKYLERLKSLEDEEDEDVREDAKSLYTSLQKARKSVKELFGFLKKLEDAKKPREYSKILEEAIKIVKSNATEEDGMALERLKDVIWEIENILNFIGMKEINSADYRYYLEMQIRDVDYNPPLKYESVRMSDVLTSRFSHRKIKIFVDFTEGNYPEFHPNYFYNSLEEEKHFGINKTKKRIADDKLDFYTALSHANEAYITFAEASESGVAIIPSVYLEEIIERFGEITQAESYSYMSTQEGIISYAKWARWNGRNDEIEGRFGISVSRKKDFHIKDKKNLEYCNNLSKIPVSFYRYNTYITCPLKYLFAYVMELPRNIEYDLDLNNIEIGTIYHSSLKELIKSGREKLREMDEEKMAEYIEKVARNELEKMSFFEPEIFEINLLRVSNVLVNYIENVELPVEIEGKKTNLKKYRIYKTDDGDEYFVPKEFEYSFTKSETEIEGIKFSGRIDRIDEVPSGIMIIDYKAKNAGEKEQLVLYAKICEKLLEKPVIRATFSVIEDAKIQNILDKNNMNEIWEDLVENIQRFLEGVKTGDFTPRSCEQDCKNCDFKDICSVRWPDETFKCSK